MEQPVARDLFQSEAAGIMLVEPQNKLLQTPATLETLGSTSAVPLHRLEA